MSNNKNEGKVEIIIQRHNTLKNKLGGLRLQTNEEGELAAERIEEADALIGDMCENCLEEMGTQLDIISAMWNEMQQTKNTDERDGYAARIFTASHEIKDVASMCGYSLAAYFAESLRDYIAKTALNLKNQKVIIQAHINALTVVYKKAIKDDAGPTAEELKKMVKVAIDKYG